ncbi:MAG: hypothetical protein JJU20_11080 [Opitutales bacterium]|nr:hypothetical protein [Opitutales bacterium]
MTASPKACPSGAPAHTPEPFLIGKASGAEDSLLRLHFDSAFSKPGFDPTSKRLTLPGRANLSAEPFAIHLPAVAARTMGSITYWRSESQIVGVACAAIEPSKIEQDSHALYQALLEACEGLNLYRIWNWVADINRNAPRQDEHYRQFCAGRARAFSDAFASASETRMSAASAVGLASNHLVICFTGGTAATEHRENPRQMPAYRYPQIYGPCPPSFARATRIETAQPWTFISGTASIIESETQCPDDLEGQLQVTLENLRLVGVEGASRRFIRVYLRHWKDQQTIREFLEKNLLTSLDEVSYVEADLCRADLLVEIEACFPG